MRSNMPQRKGSAQIATGQRLILFPGPLARNNVIKQAHHGLTT